MSNQTGDFSSAAQHTNPFDCIIVGAGHNGLACGLVLARNGKKVLVLVLEKNGYVGGMGGPLTCTRGLPYRQRLRLLLPLRG